MTELDTLDAEVAKPSVMSEYEKAAAWLDAMAWNIRQGWVCESAEDADNAARLLRAADERERTLTQMLLANWPRCLTEDITAESYAALLRGAGLVEWYTIDERCYVSGCCCEPGDQCQRLTDKACAALARLEADNG